MKGVKLTNRQKAAFQGKILDFYRTCGRDLPWRKDITPYRIVVSEIMLQQTQVSRAAYYYPRFLKVFPSWRSLAEARSKKILKTWQGLGYNRRALNLQKTAREVVEKYGGRLPRNPDELSKLPGIGKATAGAILAYVYNLPVPFIETNIRRTFIDAFFKDEKTVSDCDILPLVEFTLDRKNPRRWYSALMDYGSLLGTKGKNPNRKSAHYAKQPRFEGSHRQIRGELLKLLLSSSFTLPGLSRETGKPEADLVPIVDELLREGFIRRHGGRYRA